MIYIAVCDDETAIGAELESALIDILTKLNIEHEVDVFLPEKSCTRRWKPERITI